MYMYSHRTVGIKLEVELLLGLHHLPLENKHTSSRMIAKIGFVDHRIECIVGVNPSEREIEQEILLDLLVQYDVQKAVEGRFVFRIHTSLTNGLHR